MGYKNMKRTLLEIFKDQNEEKLQDYFGKNEGAMILDDDLPDAFDEWVSNLKISEIDKIIKQYKRV